MEPNTILEWLKQIEPWITGIGDALWYLLSDIILRVLGILLLVARLTPTQADNKIINKALGVVNSAVGRDASDSKKD